MPSALMAPIMTRKAIGSFMVAGVCVFVLREVERGLFEFALCWKMRERCCGVHENQGGDLEIRMYVNR